jgi:hypothetical protein
MKYTMSPLALVLAGLSLASPAWAVSQGTAATLEVKPVTMLYNLVPGVRAMTLSGEWGVSSQFVAFAGGSYSTVEVSDTSIEEKRLESGELDAAYLSSARSTGVNAGLRYYSYPMTDSFYVGGGLARTTATATVLVGESEVTANSVSSNSTLDAGYRWRWQGGFTLRTGVAYNGRATLDGEVAVSGASADEQATVDEAMKNNSIATVMDGRPMLGLDFGMGWAF